MKFNWGTGVLVFIILFLLACAAFIIFALNQDVNLVHKNYYEKGVDHSEQMKIQERSARFQNAVMITNLQEYVIINIEENLHSNIDSGTVTLFRPSDRKKDMAVQVAHDTPRIEFPKNRLISGRYILILHWHTGGEEYEVRKTVMVK